VKDPTFYMFVFALGLQSLISQALKPFAGLERH